MSMSNLLIEGDKVNSPIAHSVQQKYIRNQSTRNQKTRNQQALTVNNHGTLRTIASSSTRSNQHIVRTDSNLQNTTTDDEGMATHRAVKKLSNRPANLTCHSSPQRHIVLVTETWHPDINGVAMSLGKLMSCLHDMGHNISLIRPKPKNTSILTHDSNNSSCISLHNNTKQPFITNDIQVSGIPIPKYNDLQLGMPSYKEIKQQLQRIKPDLVHIATEGPLGLSTLIVAKRLKLPVTTGYHTQFHDFSKHFGFGILARPMIAYFRYLHNWSNATCVPSQKAENDLAKIGFKRLYQVGRGVDMTGYDPQKYSDELRQTWGAGHQHTVLIMVSRLSPEKDVDLVIKAFTALQIKQLHRAFKLIIVGDGPDKRRLESLSIDNEDIIFAGMQTGENLATHYASGDAFVFASQVETFGNVVTEAMASGLPVFAFDDAAAGMLVDESCGNTVTVGKPTLFTEMVSNLPKLHQLKKQGKQARLAVSAMSWQRSANQMLGMFEDAITTKKPNLKV